MSIHEKLAERFNHLCGHKHCVSCATLGGIVRDISDGDLDDILGVRKPELKDVKREAIRAYGPKARVHLNNAPNAGPPWFLRVAVGGLSNVPLTVTDNDPISMAYAALLRAPDYEENE